MDRALGPRLKIERAEKHIGEFDVARAEFIEGDAYVIVREEEPNTRDLVHRVRINAEAEHRGLGILATIAGDAIHNLRAALDLLAWQLVDAHSGKTHDNTNFTIHRTREAFERASNGAGIDGAAPGAIKLWQSLKPYCGGNPALWNLHRLDGWDKHRLLIASTSIPVEAIVSHPRWLSRPLGLRYRARKPLINGAEVYRVPGSLREATEDQPNPEFILDVAFGKTEVLEGKPILPELHQLAGLVRSIVGMFRPYIDPDDDILF